MKQTIEARWFFTPDSDGAHRISQYIDTVLGTPFSMKFNRHDFYFMPLIQHNQSYIIRNNKVHIIKLHTLHSGHGGDFFVCEKYKIGTKPTATELQAGDWISIQKERILLPFLDKHLEISSIQINKKDIYYTIGLEVSQTIEKDLFLQEGKNILKTLGLEKHCNFNSIESYPTFIKSHSL